MARVEEVEEYEVDGVDCLLSHVGELENDGTRKLSLRHGSQTLAFKHLV